MRTKDQMKRHTTIQINELIQYFCDEFEVEWNDACKEIGDEDFRNQLHELHEVEDMVEDGYNQRAWTFLRDYMVTFNLKEIRVVND